jgi:Uma2 family endonuclease
MASTKPRILLALEYEELARKYCESLPLEHFMEAIPQATQREITLESLSLVKAHRPDFHLFNELLVQYPYRGYAKPRQVVPDNMVVLSDKPFKELTSFNLPLETVRPFWMLEYVSKSNKRKDYEDNFQKYERELKVPWYLLFYPDNQELTLYRHNSRKYVSVKPDEHGRRAIPALEIEVELLDGWVRYRYQHELLPLPAEMERSLEEARRRAVQAEQRAEAAEREVERLRAQLRRRNGPTDGA